MHNASTRKRNTARGEVWRCKGKTNRVQQHKTRKRAGIRKGPRRFRAVQKCCRLGQSPVEGLRVLASGVHMACTYR